VAGALEVLNLRESERELVRKGFEELF